jgi:hypothetical protein
MQANNLGKPLIRIWLIKEYRLFFNKRSFGTGSAAWELEKVAEKGIQELGDRAAY